jgi:prefoldin subunit 5
MTKSLTDFKMQMEQLDKQISVLGMLIIQLGLLPSDTEHCLKVLSDLQYDVEKMTGMY